MTIEQRIEQLRGNDPTLKKLDLGGTISNPDQLNAVAETLKYNTNLLELYLDWNDFNQVAYAKALAYLIRNNRSLQKLSLIDTKLTSTLFIVVADALKENATLSILNLDNNEIGNEGATKLAEVLKSNQGLRTLSCENCSIGSGSKGIGDALCVNRTLQVLTWLAAVLICITLQKL
jgi:NLR family CARD domain-containing protein 3